MQSSGRAVALTEMSVAVGGNHLKNTVIDGEQGDVERAATEIKDQDVLLPVPLVQAVGDGRRRSGQTPSGLHTTADTQHGKTSVVTVSIDCRHVEH